jgi:hypothetical protein
MVARGETHEAGRVVPCATAQDGELAAAASRASGAAKSSGATGSAAEIASAACAEISLGRSALAISTLGAGLPLLRLPVLRRGHLVGNRGDIRLAAGDRHYYLDYLADRSGRHSGRR